MAKESAIGPNGRTVRCAKCSNAWFVAPPAEELGTPDDLQLQDIERESAKSIDSVLSKDTQSPTKAFGETPAFTSEDTPEPDIQGASLAARGADALMRDKVEAEKRRARQRVILMIWFIPLLFIFGLCVVLFVARESIAERFPASVPYYNAMNINVSHTGLKIEAPQMLIAERDNGAVIEIVGKVKNLTQKAKPLPPVILTLHNPAGEEVTRWEYTFEQKILPAYSEVEYRTEYVNPPPDSDHLQFRLADIKR